MNVIVGTPEDWVDLIDSMVPEILRLVVDTWESHHRQIRMPRSMTSLGPCVARCDRTKGRGQLGRLDIVFIPMVPDEDIYFCLESKRLNVVTSGRVRPYASEDVMLGMLHLVTGQYAKAVRHGGMLGYVLDGNVESAFRHVEDNVRTHCVALLMATPTTLTPSTLLRDVRARESHHHRAHEIRAFCIHHLFMLNGRVDR